MFFSHKLPSPVNPRILDLRRKVWGSTLTSSSSSRKARTASWATTRTARQGELCAFVCNSCLVVLQDQRLIVCVCRAPCSNDKSRVGRRRLHFFFSRKLSDMWENTHSRSTLKHAHKLDVYFKFIIPQTAKHWGSNLRCRMGKCDAGSGVLLSACLPVSQSRLSGQMLDSPACLPVSPSLCGQMPDAVTPAPGSCLPLRSDARCCDAGSGLVSRLSPCDRRDCRC